MKVGFKGFKAILVILLSLAFLSFPILSTTQDSKKPDFSEWLGTAPLGLTAMSFTRALFLLDMTYYQALTPEQIKTIKKIQGEALSSIFSQVDKHTSYVPAEEYQDFKKSMEGKFEGVGLLLILPELVKLIEKREAILKQAASGLDLKDLNLRDAVIKHLRKVNPEFEKLINKIREKIIPDEGILIEEVMSGTPAEKAGVKKGWYIIEVDAKKVEGMPLEEAIKLIKGTKGTKVKLTLYPPKDERGLSPIAVEIERGIVKTSLISKGEMLNSKVGYIKFTDFYEGVDQDFKNNIATLKSWDMKSLIIDLRDNPGGLLHMADRILEVLLPGGRIEIYAKYRDGSLESYWSPPENKVPKIFSGKIAVLINGNSASAAELVASSLKEQGVAVIIGKKSYGKASIQVIEALPDGSGLRLTIGHYLSPVSGEDIDGKGVIPDIDIGDDPNTPEDEVVEKAIEVLKN